MEEDRTARTIGEDNPLYEKICDCEVDLRRALILISAKHDEDIMWQALFNLLIQQCPDDCREDLAETLIDVASILKQVPQDGYDPSRLN